MRDRSSTPDGASVTHVGLAAERRAAGRLAGAMLFAGGCAGVAWIFLPGANLQMPAAAILALIALAAGVGTSLAPWARLPESALYYVCLPSLAIIAGVIATTGGVTSPARFYLMMVDVFAAYYFSPRWAGAYAVACTAVHASPLLYDPRATHAVFLGELIVVSPVYAAVAVVVVAAKRRLVTLHAGAESASRSDPLTTLANRRGLLETMQRWSSQGKGVNPFGLILLDLDNLKLANSLHGHAGGDRVLSSVADALRKCSRPPDLPARLGGDEFAVLVWDTNAKEVGRLADNIIGEIRYAGVRLSMTGVRLSASAGWAIWPNDGLTADEMLAAADHYLYDAKTLGKDRAMGNVIGELSMLGMGDEG